VNSSSLEGYLAPDSYEFLPGTSPEVAFRTMAERQQTVLRRAMSGRDSLPLGFTVHQILSLASIVESEAMKDDERPRIARVYMNRLERGMKLQADPTVSYGLGRSPHSRVYLGQLRSNTPFNTYLYVGLPPGPICNPGRSSIEAVMSPTADMNELYFVARGDGRHIFARTYAEHLANIREARVLQSSPGSARSSRAESLLAMPPS